MAELFFVIQFLLYFIGISFSTGGGNHPGLSSNAFIYLKGAFLFAPILGFLFQLTQNYRTTLQRCRECIVQNRFLFLYLVFGFLSIPLAVDPSYSLQRLVFMIIGLSGIILLTIQFHFFVSRGIQPYPFFEKAVTALTVLSLVFPLTVLVNYGWHDLIPGYRSALQSYLLIHPNLLASFYAHLAVFQCGYILYSHQRNLIINQICLAFLTILIVLLFSRTVFLSLLIAGFSVSLIFFGLLQKRRYLLIPLLGIGATALLSIFLMIGSAYPRDFFEVFTRGDNISSMLTITNRTELWRILLEQVTIKTALVGNGFSVMTNTFGIDFGTGILYGAHNAYLSIFLGTGIFSLICILWYFGASFIRTWRSRFQLPLFASFALFSSLILFAVNCLTAEEVGVNTTVTFSYMIFLINILLFKRYHFENSADRL